MGIAAAWRCAGKSKKVIILEGAIFGTPKLALA
jgi:hypothetical protein